ncbi:Crp/Fnr family transcriptional regulator [Clostridium sp. 19966]|uniref:Crp/Fnr family transcriptional regulator n=1 Tax=Clostridium sp. 19966 TaxID=2768166 RepID=UPI0028E03D32|nr:Crp/Fnr family transcriptional regulator [Clostridium sp. 19966]MDT8717259.1 Crp/Fnr family transcriptional regulator [Clostridium sp. 19966]
MNIENFIDILVKTKLFNNMSSDKLYNFFSTCKYTVKKYNKNDLIFSEDDNCNNLSILLDGEVEIQKIDVSGKLLVVAKFERGDTFGENLIFGDVNRYPMSVVCKSSSEVLHIPKKSVLLLCQEDTVFLYEFLRTLSNRAVNLSSKLKQVTLKTIRQKICEFIYEKYENSHNVNIEIEMSKKEWADKLGVQRPSLSRELIKMKEEGLIDYDKNTIVIKDIDGIIPN